jgi:HAD superfamily hydrolase (TIGR01450 family)
MSTSPLLSRPDRIFDGYAFDLDGTVYLGDELLPGSARLLAALRKLGRRVSFVSNNPTRTPLQYVDKLGKLGVQAGEDEVINTVVTTVDWVLAECPNASVFAIAEEPLLQALQSAGVHLSEDPTEIDVVIASFDRSLEYRKLQIAFDALWRRDQTRLVATNPDPYCPTREGGEPDAAAVIAALEACTGRTCEMHFGKPGGPMMDTVTRRLGLPPEARPPAHGPETSTRRWNCVASKWRRTPSPTSPMWSASSRPRPGRCSSYRTTRRCGGTGRISNAGCARSLPTPA